uniref:ATP synthase F0 subunit 6 n=1 Tax=Clavisyllis tenjini TaxID=3041283 RepID=UPI00255206E8|nr:ATP synthase F0 subunit 6 [Clavisyllis tenjini]WGF21046.1 ATP synthase F0 subunit 6 [Clavisyllis tenjini]
MMLDIFSSFDPYISSSLVPFNSLMWFMSISLLLIFIQSFWIAPNSSLFMFLISNNLMISQTKFTTGTHLKSFMFFIAPLFIILISINLTGMIPYMFSSSSHLILLLSLGLPLWLTLLISSFLFNPSTFTASLLPGGAPDWLNPFLVIVESISIIARPITLSFRLAANMTAGHLILSLMGSYLISLLLNSSFSFSSFISLGLGMGYILFEIGICLIQSYIFCLLLTLYSDDHS